MKDFLIGLAVINVLFLMAMVMQMETGGYDVDLIWIAMCFINGAIFALVIVVYFIGSIIKLYKFLSAYKANHKI